MKSKIRIISYIALLVPIGGAIYFFWQFPYEPANALMYSGILFCAYIYYVATHMICENCGKSMYSELMELPGLPGTQERNEARRELFKKGYHTFPFKKHRSFCGVERY